MARPRPPHPKELGATRFFARLVAFDCECPRCGKVLRIRQQDGTRLKARSMGREGEQAYRHAWEPASSTLRCLGKDGCGKVFRLGILAWDPPRGAAATAIPEDQVPNPRQLGELRAEGDGWWMPEGSAGIGRMDHSNWAAAERPDLEDEDE